MSKAVESESTTTKVDINQQASSTAAVDEDKPNANLHISVSSKGDAKSEVGSRMHTRTRD